MKFCVNCGSQLEDAAKFCPACGQHIAQAVQSQQQQIQPTLSAADNMVTPDQRKLSPGIAALLSVLLIGLGQMINGQVAKGLVLLFGTMALGAVLAVLTFGISIFISPAFWIVSAIDAYRCAKKLQEGKCIGKWSFF